MSLFFLTALFYLCVLLVFSLLIRYDCVLLQLHQGFILIGRMSRKKQPMVIVPLSFMGVQEGVSSEFIFFTKRSPKHTNRKEKH